MTAGDRRTAAAAALATLLGACALVPVYASGAWLPPVAAAVGAVWAGGVLLRRSGPALWGRMTDGRPVSRRWAEAGIGIVPVGQLVLLTCLLTTLYASDRALLGVVPTPASLRHLRAVLVEGTAEMREQATPALPLPALVALTVLFVGLVAVATDLLAVAGRQAAPAGLGLLIIYCVPVATIKGSIGLVPIAAPAAGFALLLWADQDRRISGRGTAGGGPADTRRWGTGAALGIGAVALAAALVVGAVVPTLAERTFGSGTGGGAGNATGTSLDPAVQLRGQLTLPKPIPLLQVRASVEDPGYLRSVVLDRYDAGRGWLLSNLDGEISLADDRRLAPLPSRLPSRPVTATIRAIRHDDRFLPVLYSPVSVRMINGSDENWRFDPATAMVFGRRVTTSGRSYSVSAMEPRPSPALLADAAPLSADDPIQQQFTALPALDPSVPELVATLTADAAGPYAQVRAILDYLTDRGNGFAYSLSTRPGTSDDDLVNFLEQKRGYCEQYAGAMAVMARAAGLPARVAMGYTPGTVLRNGSRLITSDDAHAWVEVYFAGLGWVPFDPTPVAASRAVQLPWAPQAQAPDVTDGTLDVAVPTRTTQAGPTVRRDRAGEAVPKVRAAPVRAASWRPLLVGAGVAVLLAGLVLLPAGLRALQRRRRLAEGRAGDLWDELIASAMDLGVSVHTSWTPRTTARELGAVLERAPRPVDPVATEAVSRLASAEEMASYGAGEPGRAQPDLRPALRTARRGLARATPRRDRLRALLWPASLMAGAGARLAERASRLLRPDRVRRRTV